MSQEKQDGIRVSLKDTQTKLGSWVLIMFVFCLAAIGLYFVAGAFVTGIVGVGTLASLFQKAAGA